MTSNNFNVYFNASLIEQFKNDPFITSDENIINQVFDIAKNLLQKEHDYTRKEPMKQEELAFLSKYTEFKCSGYEYLNSTVKSIVENFNDKKDKIDKIFIDFMVSLDECNIHNFIQSLEDLAKIINES